MREAGYLMPKFLMPIADQNISFFLFKNLKKYGIETVHLLLGDYSDEIKSAVKVLEHEFSIRITYSQELQPRGTAGALLDATEFLHDEFMLLHGDLLVNTDFTELLEIFDKTDFDFAQMVHPSTHVFDSDLVKTDNEGQIIGYETKPHADNLLIRNLGNAGIYAFKRKVFLNTKLETSKVDLDREFLPEIVSSGFKGLAIRNRQFIRDVGTPERYEKTVKNLKLFRDSDQPKPAIFLDRDGTINKLNGYIKSHNEVHLLDGVAEAILRLNKSGFLVIVITNQPVIARGETSITELNRIHARIEMELSKYGALLDEIYFCPHHPDSGFNGEIPELKFNCICRKPKTGLVQKACSDFQIDLSQSWMIGDSWRDVKLAENVGIKSLKVGSGEKDAMGFDFKSLSEAVDHILSTVKAE